MIQTGATLPIVPTFARHDRLADPPKCLPVTHDPIREAGAMAKTKTNASSKSESQPLKTSSASAMRVDAAHVVSEAPPAPAEGHGAVPTEPETDALAAAQLLNQVRTQATQLATHLRNQQTDLDQREAQLNARTAELENQIRMPDCGSASGNRR